MSCVGNDACVRLDWVGPLVLCREEIARVPWGIRGVYILHGYDSDRGWYPPLYAGKAGCLSQRLLQHLLSRSTTPELVFLRLRVGLYFSAAPVLERAKLDALEAGLVSLLRPPFNRQVPRTLRLHSNLPAMILEEEKL